MITKSRAKAAHSASASYPGRRRVICRSYPGIPEQVGKARQEIAAVLDGCPASDWVLLCLSEIATNTVIHSRSGNPGGHFTIAVDICTGEHVKVRVADDGGTWHREPYLDDVPRDHGLDIVARLSSAMGIEGDETCRAVWFTCNWAIPAETDKERPG